MGKWRDTAPVLKFQEGIHMRYAFLAGLTTLLFLLVGCGGGGPSASPAPADDVSAPMASRTAVVFGGANIMIEMREPLVLASGEVGSRSSDGLHFFTYPRAFVLEDRGSGASKRRWDVLNNLEIRLSSAGWDPELVDGLSEDYGLRVATVDEGGNAVWAEYEWVSLDSAKEMLDEIGADPRVGYLDVLREW